MTTERRSLQSIKTMGKLLDGRRARTPAGALLEMSAMANEKVLLTKELERSVRRRAEIEARLAEIYAKTQRLLAYVQDPTAAIAAAPLPAAGDPATAAAAAQASALAGRFKATELHY